MNDSHFLKWVLEIKIKASQIVDGQVNHVMMYTKSIGHDHT